jgi:hypothetical protein
MRSMRAGAIALLTAAAMGLAACGGDDSGDGTASCEGIPDPALTPSGTGPDAFTMGIRVNQEADLDEIKSDLSDRILPRDVFVINTEFAGSEPSTWDAMVDRLGEDFPCNRIATLNGLASDPTKGGYAFALADNPEIDAILVDWEQISYELAGKGKWSPSLEQNLPRIEENLRLLGEKLASKDTRVGLAPQYLPPWDYGRTARTVALANIELNPEHRGYQIVQTQVNCGNPKAAGPSIGPLSATLIRQYRSVLGERLGESEGTELTPALLQHLGFEIAFDEDPEPHASEAIDRIGEKQAAACTKEILDAGGAGILYWATPLSLRAMLQTPYGRTLRPSSSS